MAQVTTAHTAAGAEQLNLAPGQLILILTKNSSGWWLGELQVSELLMHKDLKWAIFQTFVAFPPLKSTYVHQGTKIAV